MVFTDSHPYNVRRARVVQYRRSPEVVNEMVARHKRTKRSMGCVKKADNEDNASAFYMALLASYWFASSAQTLACSMLIIPYQILKMVGLERKGTYLGLTMLFSSVVTVISGPLSGTLSDRSKLPFGRRRVFILVGTLINAAGLMMFQAAAESKMILVYMIIVAVQSLGTTVATTVYQSMIPDLIPRSQMGMMSGWLGLCMFAGALVGTGLVGILLSLEGVLVVCVFLGLLLSVFMVVAMLFEEPRDEVILPGLNMGRFFSQMVEPFFESFNFTMVFLLRFAIQMGIQMLEILAYYYIVEVVKDYTLLGVYTFKDATQAASVKRVISMVVAAVFSFGAGKMSDKMGRKGILTVGTVVMAGSAVWMIFVRTLDTLVLQGMLQGMGFGIYISTEFALVADILPSSEVTGKYLGVWHLAMTVPSIVASPLAGFLLDYFQLYGKTHGMDNLGYTVVLVVIAAVTLFGTFCIQFIGIHKPAPVHPSLAHPENIGESLHNIAAV